MTETRAKRSLSTAGSQSPAPQAPAMTDEANEEIGRQTRAILIELVAFTVLAIAIAAVLAFTA